jgi:hypothetical protein
MSAETASASTEFDIFAKRSVQTSTLDTIETSYKPIASVDQTDLEFFTGSYDTYIDLNIHLIIRGKLIKAEGKELDATDYTAVTKNLLHSLFSQCTITLNSVTITPASGVYLYRAYLEALLTNGSDAAVLHLTNTFCYQDNGNTQACDPTSTLTIDSNTGFIAR